MGLEMYFVGLKMSFCGYRDVILWGLEMSFCASRDVIYGSKDVILWVYLEMSYHFVSLEMSFCRSRDVIMLV